MKFVFIDEHHAKLEGRKYTALVATVFDSSSLRGFRRLVIDSVRSLVDQEEGANGTRTIGEFPTIHGRDMAPGHTDTVKLGCHKIVAEAMGEFGCRVYGLGYFEKVPGLPADENRTIGIGLLELMQLVNGSEEDELVTVYELDTGRHKRFRPAYNDFNNQYWLRELGEENNSYPSLDREIGRFYGDKRNYHLASADIASYYLMLSFQKRFNNADVEWSPFKRDVFLHLSPIANLVRFFQVKQWNAGKEQRAIWGWSD